MRASNATPAITGAVATNPPSAAETSKLRLSREWNPGDLPTPKSILRPGAYCGHSAFVPFAALAKTSTLATIS